MGDDLTDMGISATAAATMGREQIVLAHQAEHPLAGNTDVATDPKPSPDLAVVPRPPRAMPPGRLRWPPAEPGPRSRASVPERFAVGCSSGAWPGARHGVERGAGNTPQAAQTRTQAVGQTRAGRGGGTHRRDLRRPKGPKGLRLGLQQFHLHGQLPDPLHGDVQFRLTGSPLRSLSEASIPPIAVLTPLLEPEASLTPNWRDKSSTGSPRKSRRATSRLRATVHRWPSPSGPAGESLAWGKRGRAKLALVYHRPINSNFLLKIVGHVPVLLGHFD